MKSSDRSHLYLSDLPADQRNKTVTPVIRPDLAWSAYDPWVLWMYDSVAVVHDKTTTRILYATLRWDRYQEGDITIQSAVTVSWCDEEFYDKLMQDRSPVGSNPVLIMMHFGDFLEMAKPHNCGRFLFSKPE